MAAPLQEDDVPPLEDMSDLLNQVQEIQKNRGQFTSQPIKPENAPTNLDKHSPVSTVKEEQTNCRKSPTARNKSTNTKENTFMGLKKGFLLNGFGSEKPKSSKKPSSRAPPKEPDIPLIKPKDQGSKQSGHQIKEVQDAMSDAIPLLSANDWITSDLLQKIEKHPRLTKQLADPKLTQAMNRFQTDPEAAKREYADNPEIQLFFKEFCGILGDHFSKMAPISSSSGPASSPQVQTQEKTGADIRVRSSTNPKQPTAEDEARMRELLSDPEVYEIFGDERIKKLMEALRSHPDEAQRMIQTASPRLRRKVQKLVDSGLLAFAT